MTIFNVGVIGTGMLGSAILKNLDGLSEQSNLNIYCCNRTTEKAIKFTQKSKSIKYCSSLAEIVNNCQYIFLAVNTESALQTTKEIAELASKDFVLLSAEAVTKLEELENCFKGNKALIARIMLNTNISSRGSAIVYTFNKQLRESQFGEHTEKLLSMLGSTTSAKENQLLSYTVIAGCLPSFIYIAVEAVQDAAVCSGLPIDEATDVLLETWLGALSRVKESKKSLNEIKHELYYPNGITIKGIRSLEKEGFRRAIIESYLKMM